MAVSSSAFILKGPLPAVGEEKRFVVGEKPVMIGTRKVAPNIAAIC